MAFTVRDLMVTVLPANGVELRKCEDEASCQGASCDLDASNCHNQWSDCPGPKSCKFVDSCEPIESCQPIGSGPDGCDDEMSGCGGAISDCTPQGSDDTGCGEGTFEPRSINQARSELNQLRVL